MEVIVLTHDSHRPGGPVLKRGIYAAVTPARHELHSWHLPAGAVFAVHRDKSVYYVLIGLAEMDCF